MKFNYKHIAKASVGISLATSGLQADVDPNPNTFGFENLSSYTYNNGNFTETVNGTQITFSSNLESATFNPGSPISGSKGFQTSSSVSNGTLTFNFNKAVNLTSLDWKFSSSSTSTVSFLANGLSLNSTGNSETSANGTYDLSSIDNITTLTLSNFNFNYISSPFLLDNLIFELAPTSSYLTSTTNGGGNTPEKSAASELDRIQNKGGHNMSSLFTALDSLSSDSSKANAIKGLTPSVTGSTIIASSQIAGNSQNIVSIAQGSGGNSGDELFVDKSVWFKPFGSYGVQNDKDGFNGFDMKAYGFGVGTDGEYKNSQLGMAFFYTNANIDINNVVQTADLDVFSLIHYGTIPVIDDKTSFLYQLGYSLQKTETNRSTITGTANADFTAHIASLDLKLVRNYKLNDDLKISPVIETTYRNYSTPSYNENGAGAANLNIQSDTYNELIASVGTLVDYKLDTESKVFGSFFIGYDLLDEEQSTTYSFANAGSAGSTSVGGIDNGRWETRVGLGYEKTINSNGSTINFSVDHKQRGMDYRDDSISTKYVYKF